MATGSERSAEPPLTTDLDALAAAAGDGTALVHREESAESSSTETTTTTTTTTISKTIMSAADQDDAITVKYLPLNDRFCSPAAEVGARGVGGTISPRPPLVQAETGVPPASVQLPAYANRGHLQSLLVQKQQTLRHRLPLHDQYTQYRASDLINQVGIPVPATRVVQFGAPRTKAVQLQQLHQHQRHYLRQEPAREPIPTPAERSDARLGTHLLSSILKRPLELLRRTKSLSKARADQPEVRDDDSQYKVPAAKQHYSTSQSLYLLPAPDRQVHIATVATRDISAAQQRLQQKSKSLPASDSRVQTKLSRLFRSFRAESPRRQPPRARLRSSSFSFARTRTSARRSRSLPSKSSDGREIAAASLVRAKVKMPSGKTDRASVVDNKDGTVKISYEPKEVGQHEISLRYNDQPIDEGPIVFYVDAVGAAKKKITAYGAGLTHGQAGEQSKFTINTGGLGSAKLSVVVEGPSKTQVSLADNKDGTISVGYLPLLPGEYKVKISFDNKQLVGSPFAALVGDEGRQRSRLSVGRGSEHTLDLKIGEEELKTLNAVIVSPCGLEEPCGLKLLKSGQLAIVFTPREQGEHSVSVRRRGNHLQGSPFKFDVLSRDIGDAKQVKVSGKGLKEGKTNTANEIVVNTREAGFGGLSVALEGPGRSEISSQEALADGTIRLSYTPYEPGNYNLVVKYADHVVPGSPFAIKVSGQGSNPQRETLRKFRKAAPVAEVNSECQFSFKMPGTSAYDLSARIHSPQGNAEDASIKDKGEFVYQVSFVPKESGLYALSIRNKDIHVAGSPFPFSVGGAPLESGPHKVRCGGPGLIRGACNKWNEFNVYTREAGAGELHLQVEGPAKPELQYSDRRDGSCHVGYRVAEPGEYRVSVFFNDQEVPESPFRAYVMPTTGDAAKIELGPMPPESMIQLNKPCNLTVIMNGAKGNIEAKVRLPSGKLEDCFASPIDAENWGVRFIPRELGIHQVHVKFDKGSTHIPQSPVFIQVGHDGADAAAVRVHGQGLKGATVNHATDFTVETCNAGHALLEVNIEGPSKVSMGCAEIDEGYKVEYTALAPGDYLISIKYNGCHIGSSPFRVRALKQPGSRTVADAGAHEVASLAIATTEREAKQKVEQMPKFKSDASRVYCKGMGLKKAFAGKPNTLTVNCSEAGFNMIYVSFLGPTRNTIHECSAKHMGGSIYEVKYTCKDRGDAILIVRYGDEQIPGSPFRLECV